MIVNKQLVVSNRKKAEIVADLRHHQFRPFLKTAKAKAAGETEPAEDEEDDEADAGSSASDFDYLLGMAIWSLTKEKVSYLMQGLESCFSLFCQLIDRAPQRTSCRERTGAAGVVEQVAHRPVEHRLGFILAGVGGAYTCQE